MNLVSEVSKFRSRTRGQKCGYFVTSVKTTSVRDKSVEIKRKKEMTEPSLKHHVRRISCQKTGEETHVATKGNPNCTRQNTVVSYGPEDSLAGRDKGRRQVIHNDNPTVSVRDGSAGRRHDWQAAAVSRPGCRSFASVDRRTERRLEERRKSDEKKRRKDRV
jgi:hypothetical protein